MKVVVYYCAPPAPGTWYTWCAYVEGDESVQGWGGSASTALLDLAAVLSEREEQKVAA